MYLAKLNGLNKRNILNKPKNIKALVYGMINILHDN